MPSDSEHSRSSSDGLNSLVRDAFLRVSNGYSPDRIVADPPLNQAFLTECAKAANSILPVQLNRRLINLRKMGLLADVRATRRTSFQDEEHYRHSSECAVRFLEKRDSVSLDEIICDPVRANEFDSVAGSIAGGFLPVQYRWAALNLRKSSRLKPELMSHVIRPTGIMLGRLHGLELSKVPTGQGLYVFYASQKTLYIGEASNLRIRLGKHADHSDNRDLARWFWEHGFQDVTLEVQVLPETTSKRIRRALESELINSRRPLFNVQR